MPRPGERFSFASNKFFQHPPNILWPMDTTRGGKMGGNGGKGGKIGGNWGKIMCHCVVNVENRGWVDVCFCCCVVASFTSFFPAPEATQS